MRTSVYTLDRFEGDIAVLLAKDHEEDILHITKSEMPAEAEKGDLLEVMFEKSTKKIRILQEETKQRREKMNRLFEKVKHQNNPK